MGPLKIPIGFLRGKSTDGSLLGSCIVVGHVVVGGDHDVTIGAIREGVAVGLVKVAGATLNAICVIVEVAVDVGWGC